MKTPTGAPFSICLARSPDEPKEKVTLPLPEAAKALPISVMASLVLAAAKTTVPCAWAAPVPSPPIPKPMASASAADRKRLFEIMAIPLVHLSIYSDEYTVTSPAQAGQGCAVSPRLYGLH